jgi:hypothetical protein
MTCVGVKSQHSTFCTSRLIPRQARDFARRVRTWIPVSTGMTPTPDIHIYFPYSYTFHSITKNMLLKKS